jgi:hypothetical protein
MPIRNGNSPMLSYNSKPSFLKGDRASLQNRFLSRQSSMEHGFETRKGRFGSNSPIAARAFYAKPVYVKDAPNSSLPFTARPAPIAVVRSPTPQIISWKPTREATPLLPSMKPESSNGSLTIKKVPLWRQAPGLCGDGN